MASGWGAPDGAVAGSWWLVAGSWWLVAGGWFLVPSYKLLATSYLHTSRPAVISTAVQWSGEISLLNGAGRITVGDLSAQSYNRALILFPHTGSELRSR